MLKQVAIHLIKQAYDQTSVENIADAEKQQMRKNYDTTLATAQRLMPLMGIGAGLGGLASMATTRPLPLGQMLSRGVGGGALGSLLSIPLYTYFSRANAQDAVKNQFNIS